MSPFLAGLQLPCFHDDAAVAKGFDETCTKPAPACRERYGRGGRHIKLRKKKASEIVICYFCTAGAEMDYQTHTLSNGIRLVHKHVPSVVAHAALFINTGSRDEHEEEHGLAHLIEHMLFKGTEKRKNHHILSRMENVGGEINAYTTKEETVIHSTFFSDFYGRALELISDIAFHSTFPAQELEKEKEIILDEINSYKDSPSELIFDEFEELLFDGNPLARNILGDPANLRKFGQDVIKSFICNNYSTEQMVLSSVGRIDFKKLIRLFEINFGGIRFNHPEGRKKGNYGGARQTRVVERNTHQTHCIIGNLAYDIRDRKRLALYLLNNLLGGPGMNSKLNMALRERRGLAYSVDSLYTAYSDTGNLTIYFGTDKNLTEKCISIILKEIRGLQSRMLSTVQLHKAKRQIMGHFAIAAEINENYMLSQGKSMLVFGKVESLEETAERVNAITGMQLMEVANEILDTDRLSLLIYR